MIFILDANNPKPCHKNNERAETRSPKNVDGFPQIV
jgi:hypothetical protein